MRFEFDRAKSISTKFKHGLDFGEAQELWKDWTIIIPAKVTAGEPRYAVLGTIGGQAHTAIIAYRGATIRIIGVRPSNRVEKNYYDKNTP